MTLNASFILRVGALVMFILAAIFGISDSYGVITLLWIISVGLGAWVASTVVP